MSQTPTERINQVRKCLHVHSILYYHMDTNIVDDAIFDKWSVELVNLHKKYPKLVLQGYEFAMFSTWDGSSGYHLQPTEWSVNEANWLTREHEKRKT